MTSTFLPSLPGSLLSLVRQLQLRRASPPFLIRLSHSNDTIAVGNAFVGTLWFAIFLQLFLIIGVVYTLATDSIAMHRFQISVFGAIAVVFAVNGVHQGIFTNIPSLNAMSAGWLILSMVDILWVLYFTSEEDSLALYVFNSLGTGGLTPPSRRRRTRTAGSIHNMSTNNGYATNYGSGGGIGSHDMAYGGPKMGSGIGSGLGIGSAPAARSQNSFGGAGSVEGANRSIGQAGSIHNVASNPGSGGPGSIGGGDTNGPSSPLMGMGGGSDVPPPDAYSYKAKALYACAFFLLAFLLIWTLF
jgi:SHO1 osmosensor